MPALNSLRTYNNNNKKNQKTSWMEFHPVS